MRTSRDNILELFEDKKHGRHSNIGIYDLKNINDTQNFTFYQDSDIIAQII